jgi:hypothetical protein
MVGHIGLTAVSQSALLHQPFSSVGGRLSQGRRLGSPPSVLSNYRQRPDQGRDRSAHTVSEYGLDESIFTVS